jgi:hypothetical protein
MKNMNLIIIAFIAGIVLVTSCQKDNINVTLTTSGKLHVTISDSTGKKYEGVLVHLYVTVTSSSNEIDTKRTDKNGSIDFGTLAPDKYFVVTDKIKNGNKKYKIERAIQVNSGELKEVILNPFEFVGTLKMNVSLYSSSSSTIHLSNLKVALVDYDDYYPPTVTNRQKVISSAVDIKNVDNNGMAKFENIPSFIRYMVYGYINNTDTMGGWSRNSYITVTKDEISSASVYFDVSDLEIQKAIASVTFEYYSYSTYSYEPVVSAQVALIKYSDYNDNHLNNATRSTILSYAVKNEVTNSSGVVNFTDIPANVIYYMYIYYSSSTNNYIWMSSIDPNVGPNSFGFTVSGSSLGLTK